MTTFIFVSEVPNDPHTTDDDSELTVDPKTTAASEVDTTIYKEEEITKTAVEKELSVDTDQNKPLVLTKPLMISETIASFKF